MAHAKLVVYERSLEAAVLLDEIARRLASERRDLQMQLQRASSSILLNVAEGASEFSPAEKARFYGMARRSASECAAILDLAERLRLTEGGPAAKDALAEVTSMLTRMITIQTQRG